MAIMIDPKGLLRGKRLRKLSHMPRLYYPYFLSLTNFYARVELDVEIIYNDLATINDPGLSETELEGYFEQYEKQGLCFIYQAKGSRWAQFDTPVSLRRSFSSAEDDASPVPPEPAYTDWLKSLHGDDWADYHMTEYKKTISDKRADAGRKGAAVTNAKRRGEESANSTKSANGGNGRQTSPDEGLVGVADEVAEAVDVGMDVADYSTLQTSQTSLRPPTNQTHPIQTVSSKLTDDILTSLKDKDKDPPSSTWHTFTARDWVQSFRWLMEENSEFNSAKLTKNWEALWEQDFQTLMVEYDPIALANLVAVSQQARSQKYAWSPKMLIRKPGKVFILGERVEEQRKILKVLRGDMEKRLARLSDPANITFDVDESKTGFLDPSDADDDDLE